MAMQLNNRVSECVRNLSDKNWMTKMTGGDVIARKFKYRRACLAALYNRKMAHFRQQTRENENEPRHDTQRHSIF